MLRKQFSENKLKFKKTCTEWTIEHIINAYRADEEHQFVVQLSKIASIVPVNNAWPERGASAVRRIKSRTRNLMKNDLLNALMLISMNGPPLNSA